MGMALAWHLLLECRAEDRKWAGGQAPSGQGGEKLPQSAEGPLPREGQKAPSDRLVATPLGPSGPRLSGGHSLHETSTVLVETVTKSSASRGSSYSSVPKFSSDASKVVTRGPGLSQAFVGQKNCFTVDCSKAGKPGQGPPGVGSPWWIGGGRR